MPAYTYEALDAEGRTQRGTVEADTPRAARAQLRGRALVPLSVDAAREAEGPSGGGVLGRPLWASRVFSRTELAVWTRQLAGLVGAGLPLERALGALGEEAAKPTQQRLMAALRAEVNGGAPLARALEQHPAEFSPTYVAVIAAGEQGGAMGRVLESLADDLEAREALRHKVLAAVLYPALVSLVAVAIVVFLLTYVVPQVAGVFEGSQRRLPLLTVWMMALSAGLREYGLALLGLAGAAGVGLGLASRRQAMRERLDAQWLRLPLLGRLARSYHAARFCGTLAMLAQAGVPILKALQTAADTLGNQALRRDALEVLGLVREGAPLAAALAGRTRFPPLVALFARLGEQTGQLPSMLGRAGAQLGAEVQRRALALATLLEPLLIVGMGLVVMLIVLAVLMPIIELNQLAGR